MTDINDADGEAVARQFADRAECHHLNASKEDGWKIVFCMLEEKYDRLDILVNNAGIGEYIRTSGHTCGCSRTVHLSGRWSMNDALVQRLRVYLEPPASRIPLAAASMAYRHGNEAWDGIITAADERSSVFVDPDSCFLVQSITKSFTAVVILRLVDSGKLTLDAPLSHWLPDLPNASRITIRQCLQHTSGLPDYGPLPEYHKAVRRRATPWTFAEFLKRTHAERLCFEPGRGSRYSNIGYMILRRLIETVGGRSFADIIKAEVCRPLGLHHTSVVKDRADFQTLTAGYSTALSSDGLPVDIREVYDPAWIATGVVASAASNVVRFYHGLFAGEFLPDRLLADMCGCAGR
ncbi:MAG: hypothetical protein C4294_09820, partial [Nitrospiraceae bacterium]